MEILTIAVLLFLLLVVNSAHLFVNYNIEKWLSIICSIEPEEKTEPEPKVTDNFQRQKEIYQSTEHIIVPKTPTEIRNQNFNKIKEGMEYGGRK